MKSFKLNGICPHCNKENLFLVNTIELDNNYHFSCSFCETETPINNYKGLK